MRRTLLLPACLTALTLPCLAQQRQPVAGEVPVPEGTYIPAQTGGANPASNLGVVPASTRTAFGNTNNSIPFSTLPTRYQQVNLGTDLPASHRIVGLGLRQDNTTGAGSTGATIDVEMKVGYTTYNESTLTTTFDNNWNAGAPLPVLPRTKVVLPTMRPTLPTDPSQFFCQIPWIVPFPWVQVAGRNILIEITVYGNDRYASFTYPLDAHSLASAGTGARLYNSGFPTAPVGTITVGYALCLNYLDAFNKTAGYQTYGTGCKGTGGFSGDILPKYYAGAMGGTANSFPWGTSNQRFQQVFLGSELPSPAPYTGLALRAGSSASTTGGNVSLEIYFGYTTYDHNTLTSNYSSNMDSGPLTQVYNGTFNFPPFAINTDPANFNQIQIPFAAPWTYIPGPNKNILMEVLNKNTTAVSQFLDNGTGANATTTRLYGNPPTAVTGTIARNYGPVIGLAKAGNGSAVPSLSATGLPILGQAVTVKLANARGTSVAICPIGSSDTLWGALPLPFDMTVVNAPGCWLRASLDGLIIGTVTDAKGNGQFVLPIPNAVGLLGVIFYNQWLVFDAPANVLGIVTTNGGKATIGEF